MNYELFNNLFLLKKYHKSCCKKNILKKLQQLLCQKKYFKKFDTTFVLKISF
jgi:hypothetical protein